MGWATNTDMAPCTDSRAVLNYIAKYATKAEKSSLPYTAIFAKVAEHATEVNPVLSAAIKMVNHYVGERDMSGQEVAHASLGLPFTFCTRSVVSLDTRPLTEQPALVEIDEGENGTVRTMGDGWLAKYRDRLKIEVYRVQYTSTTVQRLTLLGFCRQWHIDGNKLKKYGARTRDRCVNVWSKHSASTDDTTASEQYCRVVMMLHHPFLNEEDLMATPDDDEPVAEYEQLLTLGPPGPPGPSFAYAYRGCCEQRCELSCSTERIIESGDRVVSTVQNCTIEQPDPYRERAPDFEGETDVQDDVIVDEAVSEGRQQPFTELANRSNRLGPNEVLDQYTLGKRVQDRVHNWLTGHTPEYTELLGTGLEWYAIAKDKRPPVPETAIRPDTLQNVQRLVYDTVIDLYGSMLNGGATEQLLLHVDGAAGTGKSYLIDIMSVKLLEMATEQGRNDPVIRAAPTEVAAYNISGRTLYALLGLAPHKAFEPLGQTALARKQTDLRRCKFVVVDEKSMVCCFMLYKIDSRLNQIFPGKTPFGGLHVLLFVDFC